MQQLSMLIIMLAALIIPIAMARFKVSSVPTAVAEIVAGILLGKSAFNIVQETSSLTLLSSLGVIILMFLSGMEINFDLFKKAPGQKKRDAKSPVSIAVLSFTAVIITAFILGVILYFMGLFSDILLATILFSTIALGVVIATLKEKEILGRPMGQTILLTAVLGEVIPMLALTFYASIYGHNAGRLWLIVLLFLAAIILLRRFRQPYVWFNNVSKATTQLDIRLAFFLIFTLVTVAESVGAENILGAFLAGMVMKLLEPSEATQEKLTSIGYGFFIPIFFIMTGVRLDLKSLFANKTALALIPVLVLCFIIAKLPTTLIYRRRFNARNSFAGGFLTVTTITLVLPSLQVAKNLHAITSTQSDAFILAAVIVCVLAPIVFNSTYKLNKEDLVKERVVIVGANTLTVPVAQQLSHNWYVVRMLTDNQDNYKTFNSEVNDLKYIEEIDEQALDAGKYFDTDVMVLGFRNDNKNYQMAVLAKKHGVKRVIASVQNPKVSTDHIDELNRLGVEIFNSFVVQNSVLRSLIESPSVFEMLMSAHSGLFEVTIHNQRYVGIELRSLPFIDQITVSRIYRKHKPISPSGDTVLEYGDHILYTGPYEIVNEVRQRLGRRG
ncbi:cation:proton antiporter [Limosilactobacillus vaginalis]|uniref:Cation:proton antiporter n=2 Tax=Limosilactobacillus vaginalis TaxID=1633 RepID=A0ABT4K8K5_9LACO|nr:cation:proton antiporter family protein [Limosilactobacillus vaginalis]MCZ3747260.1 cation:proton antiporter [Limosilactobacillus vaginalis]MCZ3752243.1 cation:proton antiporter [Limosilactobacillus vaginalis]MCZ3753977.1 cation:proton antiporter [Limosilactobacillus vaginalis]MCZ3755667.1 cation:proton antiporter [Limosilactobacillus vaginalis]MCZ3757406.1 cation:proton antiporter [Limosilactobacillus vaginalis]